MRKPLTKARYSAGRTKVMRQCVQIQATQKKQASAPSGWNEQEKPAKRRTKEVVQGGNHLPRPLEPRRHMLELFPSGISE